jgi:hypothetical protein
MAISKEKISKSRIIIDSALFIEVLYLRNCGSGFCLHPANKCIGISTIYWNHSAFCGHSLGKPHGMME